MDRAFIDAPFWDTKKRTLQITMITPMKANLGVDSTEGLPIAAKPINAGALRDLRLTLSRSPEPWRLISDRARRGRGLAFLTNDFSLLPGVVAGRLRRFPALGKGEVLRHLEERLRPGQGLG